MLPGDGSELAGIKKHKSQFVTVRCICN